MQVTSHQRTTEKQKEQLDRCADFLKKLLIEKSELEKRNCRQQSVENCYRLGQFVTQRQGSQYVETWVDGVAFKELAMRQQHCGEQRDEIERQRRALLKRKPAVLSTPGSSSKTPKSSTVDP